MDLSGFLPSFGNVTFTIAAFVVALSIIVAVHEFGHYIVARWSGIKADVFSIGMGPVLAARTDKHGTQWQIAAFPIGGYVKFRGDANAASAGHDGSLSTLSDEERRQTMHGAPLWARASTVVAGPLFNFILSVAIFAGLAISTGVARDPLTIESLSYIPGIENELKPGDELLSIDGQTVPDLEAFYTFVSELPDELQMNYRVLRDGRTIEVTGPHPIPALVGSVSPKSAAISAGLKAGDFIATIDGEPSGTFAELREIVGNGDGKPLTLGINRQGETFDVTLTPKRQDIPNADGGFETRWLIGITSGIAFEPATRLPGAWESLRAGINSVIYIIQSSLSGLWHMVTGAISSCNLSGPIGIAEVSGQAASQGVASFIGLIAMLSTAIGLINLFPIPVLDGGHLVMYGWEAITGKPPADKVLNVLLTIGLAIVLSLMVFGVTNDLFCP